MINSKLISLLKTFSKEEMKSFGKFIESPYHNSGRNFNRLFSILKKLHPDFTEEEINEQKLFRKLYPGEKFNKKKFSLNTRVAFSQLTKLAVKFLAYEMFETGKADFHLALVGSKALEKKNLYGEAMKALTESSSKLDTKEKTVEYYYQRIYLDQLMSHNLIRTSNEIKAIEYEKNTLQNIFAYLFPMLSGFIHNARARKYNYNIEFQGFELVKSLINGFDPELFDKECIDDAFETKNKVLFNYYVLKSRIDENDKESLLTAMEIYKKMFNNLTEIFKFNYYLNLYNRFEGRHRLNRIYSLKAHELFEFISSKGCADILWSKHHPYRFFSTVLFFKAVVLEPKEIKKFIDGHVGKMPAKIRDDLKNFAMSVYYFKSGEYTKCLQNISKNDSLEVFFTLSKYKFKICSLYNLNLIEDSLYALDAFERFMRRKKEIGPQIRNENMEFIKAVKDLVQLKLSKGSNINPNEIKETNKNTLFGDWLIEKVNELQK